MEGQRFDVHHPLGPSRASSASLFHNHRDRVGFIKEAQTAACVSLAAIGGINVDAAANQDAECIRNKRPDPARVEILLARAVRA